MSAKSVLHPEDKQPVTQEATVAAQGINPFKKGDFMKNYQPYHRDHTVSKLIVLLLLIIIMAALKTDTIIATIKALLDAFMPVIITIVGLYILVKTLFRK